MTAGAYIWHDLVICQLASNLPSLSSRAVGVLHCCLHVYVVKRLVQETWTAENIGLDDSTA